MVGFIEDLSMNPSKDELLRSSQRELRKEASDDVMRNN